MKLLYLGIERGTSEHRANALRRLGHSVMTVNPSLGIPSTFSSGPMQRILAVWARYAGYAGLASLSRNYVLQAVSGKTFDAVWVDGGALVSRGLVEDLKKIAGKVVNYNLDDPYGNRDANYWRQYLNAIPAYDLIVVVREENVQEARQLHAKKVLHVFRAADEVAHAPRVLTEKEKAKWGSEILFVGTAFPERGPFFAELIRLGVPISIYGGRRQRLKEWKTIEGHWKGPGLEDAYTYSTAILAAKACLGLLSSENRDLHTQRSMEIPALGGVFCAQRTSEHLALYREDQEAVFWDSPEECANKCSALLRDDAWRESVAHKGHERYLTNGWTNMKVAEKILTAAFE